MKKILLSTIAAAALVSAPAAVNSPAYDGYLSRGRAMFADANYIGCIDQLAHIDRSALSAGEAEETDWLIARACYHVQGASAKAHFIAFIQKYPASLHRQEAMLYIGDCIMAGSYAEALKQYALIDPRTLPGHLKEDLEYRKAFCHLKLADYDRAEAVFRSLLNTKAYGNAARFYIAYIAYARHDYRQAKDLFAKVNTSAEPGNMADYYLSQIYYSEADYAKALTTARKLLRRQGIAPGYQAEANRIAGESLYRIDQPSEAIPYLKKYVAATDDPAQSAMYILGLSQYHEGRYAEAISSLQPVSTLDDAMGQSSLLYIGQALLNQGDTNAALLSLDKALRMNHDKAVQESAFYNYAVAKFRGGRIPFGSSVATFEEFLRRYPDSRYAPEVQEYVVSGWINDNNYEGALESINRMRNPGEKVLKAKQQVLYVLGSRALATGNADAALNYLSQGTSLDRYDRGVALQNALVLGEARYRKGDYAGAVKEFDRYLAGASGSDANYTVGCYDRAYAFFAQKNYGKAADDFRYVSEQKGLPAEVLADALNRLGDTYYYGKDFNRASDVYARAYEALPEAGDYPKFQQAAMKGLTHDFSAKKQLLQDFLRDYPQSGLASEAMLELAETEHSLGNKDATAVAYRRVIETYPATAQARTAYLRLGSLQLQGGARDQAVVTFKQLIAAAPTSDEASLAADYLKRIGAEDGTLAEVREYLAGIDNAPQIDVAEADRISFVTAEEAYDDRGDVSRLEAYVRDYPDGAFVAAALGYLLDHAGENDDSDKALYYARAIADRFPDNVRAEAALETIGDIEYAKGHAPAALEAYRRLSGSASSTASLNAARLGMMRACLDLGNWADALAAADMLLASSTIGSEEKLEALFCKGMALENSGKNAEARKVWNSAADETDNIFGAKSAYYMAQSYFDAKDYKNAKTAAEELTNSRTPHSYWLARGFILLSDIYRARGKKFEADSYLEALRDNYPGNEADIFRMIEERL